MNSKCEVIGVNTFNIPGGGNAQNLNFAVSIVDILNELDVDKPGKPILLINEGIIRDGFGYRFLIYLPLESSRYSSREIEKPLKPMFCYLFDCSQLFGVSHIHY